MSLHTPLCRSAFVALCLASSGCTVLNVSVREKDAAAFRRQAVTLEQAKGSPAAALLVKANQPDLPEAGKLAALLEAARLTAASKPGDPGLAVNQAATAQIVRILQARSFAPAPCAGSAVPLVVAGETKETLDPRLCDRLIPASSISIRGLPGRTTQEGVGVPYVAWFRSTSPALRGQPSIPPRAGLSEPVTAVLTFAAGRPRLVFYRTLQRDKITVAGRRVPLAADFSAQLAYLVSQGRNRDLDIGSLIFTDRNIDNAGLFQFERFDPDKIPVVFVHGLMARPETWTPAVNELLGDPEIRSRYQFWLYLYPTGLPVWQTAAKLRSEFNRFRQTLDPRRTNGNLDRMVLVGHSMGGLVSSLMIREGGKYLWKQFTDTPPEQLDLPPEAKRFIIDIVDFRPRSDVDRVVFMATPHRGSRLAVNPAAKLFADLVRLPFSPLQADRAQFLKALREDVRDLFVAPANSLVFLRANSPLLKAVLNLPLAKRVPYHSIIGDRGRGDTPDSSDGVVPYWSSHLEGAASEKIVPSGHGTNSDPEGIRELRRILLLHNGRRR